MQTLHNILFGEFNPPPVSNSHKHLICGLSGSKRYVPPRPSEVAETKLEIMQYIQQNPGATNKVISAALNRARSYTYRILNDLRYEGAVLPVRGKPRKDGGPLTTMYYIKEEVY